MKKNELAEELLTFIENGKSSYHVIAEIKGRLLKQNFSELKENEDWNLKEGKYFTIRNGSSLIAFSIPKGDFKAYQMMASHCDAPSFKIKENPEIDVNKKYTKLNVEKYGGMLCASWMDRPLSVAGRVFVQTKNGIKMKLVDVDRDLLLIPSLCIHFNREANSGYAYNPQVDMLPLFGDAEQEGNFWQIIEEYTAVKKADVIGHDLFLYNREKGSIWGKNEEYVSSPKLDDLQGVFATFKGFLEADSAKNTTVFAVFDNEEVGSATKQGAASTFLYDTLFRVNKSLKRSEETFLKTIANSFLLSVDNAHALHPNHVEKSDPVNCPCPNRGIVIKYSGDQKYTTDAVSAAITKQICQKAGVPFQTFTNRSDMAGGSTLGNIVTTKVSAACADIGLAQLAMHSSYETAGNMDTEYLIKMAKTFYDTTIYMKAYDEWVIE